jgi:isoprenylcysteine carboxyl methyltransferase (ICMT) family protein YpbQ
MRIRPVGILIIGLFLLVAPLILVVSAISLLVPGTWLDQIWVVNETGYNQMLPYRGLVATGFLALSVVIGLAGIGLLSGRKWGWWLTIIVFAANAIGDAVRFLTGDILGGSVGLVVVGLLLLYLTRPKVKDFFRKMTV